MLVNKRSISLEDTAIIPKPDNFGRVYDVADVDLSQTIGYTKTKLDTPIVGASMDSVLNPFVLADLADHGSIGSINLCGIIGKVPYSSFYETYNNIRVDIGLLQRVYSKKFDQKILRDNIEYLVGKHGVKRFGISTIPSATHLLFDDIFDTYKPEFCTVQASFISPEWRSKKTDRSGINMTDLMFNIKDRYGVDTVFGVGNVSSIEACRKFIEDRIDVLFLGIGPGSSCTSRTVLGIGYGHPNSITDIRKFIEDESYQTTLIADGGIKNSGDMVRLFSAGADICMIGSMLSRVSVGSFACQHWGMSIIDPILPRGKVLMQEALCDDVNTLFNGPSNRSDGKLAIVTAIKNAAANLGCTTLKELYYNTELIEFPGINTEGRNG